LKEQQVSPPQSPRDARRTALLGGVLRLLVSVLLVGGAGMPAAVALRSAPVGGAHEIITTRHVDHGTRISTGWTGHTLGTANPGVPTGGHGPAGVLAAARGLAVPPGLGSTPPGQEQPRPLARLRVAPARAPPSTGS
jgi:hypothetical protein